MEKNYLGEFLEKYKDSDYIRFHMPGHGGVPYSSLLDPILCYDITETEISDDLLHPKKNGFFEKTEKEIAKIYGASTALISTFGATSALQTALLLCARKSGRKIFAVERRVHSSVINAIALIGAEISFFNHLPDEEALRGSAAVLVTTPDYYGNITDFNDVYRTAKKEGVFFITDNSHGAHLEFFSPELISHRGLRIDSLHKTCPALTGSALLLDFDGDFTKEEEKDAQRIFASTSPSFPIAYSASAAVHKMSELTDNEKRALIEQMSSFKKSVSALGYTVNRENNSDPLRITLTLGNAEELYAYLTEKKIIAEFAEKNRIVFISNIFTSKEDLNALYDALAGFKPEEIKIKENIAEKIENINPLYAMSVSETKLYEFEVIPVPCSEGRISSSVSCPYPPGIPVVIPGQIISGEITEILAECGIEKINVIKSK